MDMILPSPRPSAADPQITPLHKISDSPESSGDLFAVRPGGVFVVAGVVAEAAVEDADEPVREGA
jgi:hypothetical protein